MKIDFYYFTIHLQKKQHHDHFCFLPLHFEAPMPKCSSCAQNGMENLGHYTHSYQNLKIKKIMHHIFQQQSCPSITLHSHHRLSLLLHIRT